MAKLTKKYIEDHTSSLHTYDSFGRILVDILLKEASELAGEGGIDKAEVKLEFEITPFEPLGCIRICVKRPNGHWWCVHQYTKP